MSMRSVKSYIDENEVVLTNQGYSFLKIFLISLSAYTEKLVVHQSVPYYAKDKSPWSYRNA